MSAGLPPLCGCTTAFKVVGRCCHHVSWMASRFIPTMRGSLGSHGPLRKRYRHESSFDLASMWNLKPRSELHRCEASHFSGTVTCRDSQSLPFSAGTIAVSLAIEPGDRRGI